MSVPAMPISHTIKPPAIIEERKMGREHFYWQIFEGHFTGRVVEYSGVSGMKLEVEEHTVSFFGRKKTQTRWIPRCNLRIVYIKQVDDVLELLATSDV